MAPSMNGTWNGTESKSIVKIDSVGRAYRNHANSLAPIRKGNTMPNMNDENTFVASDQLERELLWDALAEYRKDHPEHTETLSGMIGRVEKTFSWARH